MISTKELIEKAKDAFYIWEANNEVKNLSDDDRILWCKGYVHGHRQAEKRKQKPKQQGNNC